MNPPGVDEKAIPTSEANEKICICHEQRDGVVLNCHGAQCRCYNKIHPACFGMTDKDIQDALSSSCYLCPLCMEDVSTPIKPTTSTKRRATKKEDSDEEFHIDANDMSDMPSEDDEYQDISLPESDLEEDSRKRLASSVSFRGHPWSDDDEESDTYVSSRVKKQRVKSDAPEYEYTRRSTRRRRQNYSPQDLMSLDSSEGEDEEETHSYQYPLLQVSASDSGSKIERIIGRRVLANTKEAEEVMRRSRYAIGIHGDHSPEPDDVSLTGDLDNRAFEYLVKWKHQSYLHVSWVPYDMLLNDNAPHGKSRLLRFVKMLPRDESGLIIEYPPSTPDESFFNPNFLEVERVILCNKDLDVDLETLWQQGCEDVYDALCEVTRNGYSYCGPFMDPVDEVRDGAPGYYDVVKKPMCLSQIKKRLDVTLNRYEGRDIKSIVPYTSSDEFFQDLEQMFENCHIYNKDPTCDIVVMCQTLEETYHQTRYAYETRRREMEELLISMQNCSSSEVKYLVKWVDLSYKDCTWEKVDDITDKELIKAYEKRQIIPRFKLEPPQPRAVRISRGEKAILQFKDNKTLRSYQWEGFRWLRENYNEGKNSILADEMGLGKTIQVISLMEYIIHSQQTSQPILVVAPLSTLGFWRREIESWTDLNVVMYHDNEGGHEVRHLIERYEWYYTQRQLGGHQYEWPIYKFDVLLTTYEVAISDVEDLQPIRWSLVVVDEAQRMKNKAGRLQQMLHQIRWQQAVLLTGTPLQNNMMELWTLLNFVSPQTFPSSAEFLQQYGNLQDKTHVLALQKLLRVYVLRRLKEDVEDSIPPKEETIIDVELTTKQKAYYRAIYDHNRDFFIHGYVHTGLGVSKVSRSGRGPRLINMEMQFRKCCNHPYLLEGVEQLEEVEGMKKEGVKDIADHPLVSSSGKMVLLLKLLGKLRDEGHRVLIFSQFTAMLDLLERFMRLAKFTYTRIDGSIRGNAREDAIQSFNDEKNDLFCFLLSTRAGGVGITLTSADTVIIFDSDWNPQNDVQAQARCHRIGQTKAVRVYRLITRGTYEAAMFQRASMKLGLEQAVMSNGRRNISAAVVETLLKEGAYSALLEDQDGDERSKTFCESNINELLEKQSRIIKYDKTNTTLFSKTSFVSNQADTKLDINDPLFWKKIFGQDSRETILERLEDGRATKDEATKASFVTELQEMGDEVIQQKLSGANVPEWYSLLHTALRQVAIMDQQFTEEQRKQAAYMLSEIERPSRKRKQMTVREVPDDSYSVDDPDYNNSNKDALADEICCKCFHDYYLIQCHGPCHRCFHPECVENPPLRKQRDTWECQDCQNHRYTCWICHKEGYDANFYNQMIDQGLIDGEGEDMEKKVRVKKRKQRRRTNDDDYEAYNGHSRSRKNSAKQHPLVNNPNVLFKCLVKTCGRYYHVQCIQNLEYGSKERFSDLTRFRCPAHFCCKCHETGNTKHLVLCMLCSNASHVGCLDATLGHRISKLYYICNKHPVPRGIPSWDPNKKRAIADESFSSRDHERTRTRPPRPHAEKPVYEPIEYTVPIEQYKGNWCRYCGARRSSGFMKGPWGPKTLCVVHYVAWFRTKKLDLSPYPELPTKPINIEANSEPKYMYFLQTKKNKETT